MIPESILRAYDVRGPYLSSSNSNTALTDDVANQLGKCFALFLKKTNEEKEIRELKVVLGRDGRLHSPSLSHAFAQGVLQEGVSIIDIGLVPTPLVWFAVEYLNVDAGVIVTGSHNPACDNGFKMTLKDRPLTGDDLKQIVQHTSCLSLIPSLKINGIYTMLDLEDQYCARIMQDYEKPSKDKKLGKRLKVVFDPGNGATCLILKKLVKQLDIDYHILNGEIDGTFPVHDPDPTLTKNLTGLIDSVLELKADLGIAFDGDGDRIGVVDDTGYHFEGDQLMVLWVRDILKNSNSKNRKLKIVGDIKSSLILSEEVENLNAEFILCRTGHSFIKKKIKETGAIFAGEMSGHIFFNDHYFGFDDAPYAMIRLISLFNRPFHQKLSTIRKTFRKTWGTPEIKIPCKDLLKFSIIENIKEKVISDGLSFLDMDGIRVDYEDGWWLIRASNTQALLIGRVEGRTLQAKERLELEFQKYVMDFSDNP